MTPLPVPVNTITNPYVELIDTFGNLDRIQYNSTTQQPLLTQTPVGSSTNPPRQRENRRHVYPSSASSTTRTFGWRAVVAVTPGADAAYYSGTNSLSSSLLRQHALSF